MVPSSCPLVVLSLGRVGPAVSGLSSEPPVTSYWSTLWSGQRARGSSRKGKKGKEEMSPPRGKD